MVESEMKGMLWQRSVYGSSFKVQDCIDRIVERLKTDLPEMEITCRVVHLSPNKVIFHINSLWDFHIEEKYDYLNQRRYMSYALYGIMEDEETKKVIRQLNKGDGLDGYFYGTRRD